jgi:RHS repeat-associated protein
VNSRRVWNLIRVVAAVSLVLQSVASFTAMPVNAKPIVAVESQAVAEPAAHNRDQFVSPLATPVVETSATVTPQQEVQAAPVMTSTTPTAADSVMPQRVRPTMRALGQVTSKGGRVQSADGRARIEFSEGAIPTQSAEVKYGLRQARTITDTGKNGSLIEFELEAWQTDKTGQQQQLSRFSQPLTLTIDLNGLVDLNHVPEGYYVYLYTLSPEGYQTPVWPIQVNHQVGTISAQVNHFSGWGAGIAPGTPGVWEFNYTAPNVALYSGSSTVQIPLKTPSGRGGLQPNLSLSYNSATLNGLTGAVQGTRDWTRGGELGGFWNLDGFAKIAREKWDRCKWVDVSQNTHDATCLKDVFTLILDGTGYELEPAVPGLPYGRYYAVGGPNIYIYRNSWCASYNTDDGECVTYAAHNETVPANQAREYWTVRTPDGIEIRLGYNSDSEQVTGDVCNPARDPQGAYRCRGAGGSSTYEMGYKGEYIHPASHTRNTGDTTPYKVPRAWWADKYTDQSGNTMEISYYTFEYDNGERVTPKEIKYNNVPGGYLSHVKLIGVAGDGVTPPDNEPTIDRVEMWTKNSGGTDTLVRQYLLSRSWFTHSKWVKSCAAGEQPGVDCGNIPSSFEALTSVQEQTYDRTTTPATLKLLPTQVLNYEWRATRGWNDIMQLVSVNNGYGANTTYNMGQVADASCTSLGCNNYAVLTRTVAVGGSTQNMVTSYSYNAPCLDYKNAVCVSRAVTLCGDRCATNAMVKLVGFGDVAETQWEGATPVTRSKHYFKNSNPPYLKGKEYKVEQLDPANGNATLTSQETTWSDKWNGAWFAFASDQMSATYSNGIVASTRASSSVDSYSNITAIYEYGAGARVPNAGFENIQDGNNGLQNWLTWKKTGCTGTFTPGAARSIYFAGQNSLALQGTCEGAVYQDITGLVPNATYTLRLRVRKDAASDTSGFTVYMYKPDGSGTWYSGSISLGTEFSQLSADFVASDIGQTRIDLHYWTGSGKIYVDEVAVARTSDVGDERSTYSFYHNLTDIVNSRWFIGLKRGENVFSGITPNVADYSILKTQTKWFFDDGRYDLTKETDTAQITRGLVTMMARGLWETNNQPRPPVAATKYAYDAWGNPTNLTDPNGNPTVTVYDDVYHLYPVQVTNAKLQPTYYQYYGINESDAGVGSGPIGSLKRAIDPNGMAAATMYAYDTFGRLRQVAKPGDTPGIPTIEYFYSDGYSANGLSGLRVLEDYREVSGDTLAYRPILKFYDGLGRLVQERAETVNGSQQSVTNVTYDPRGLTQYSYTPDFETFNWDFIRPAGWDSRAKTTTAYDTLGRVQTVTGPDSTTTSHYYALDGTTGLPLHVVQDANNVAHKQYVQDAFGQLAFVRDIKGTYCPVGQVCGGPARELYAETKYAYDVLGNLRVVTDALQNTTVMTYNVLGQKTGMSDPDMGVWSYQYDNAGNLKVQDDANHKRLCFSYDELNRMLGKSDTTDQLACPAATTTYGYDAYDGATQFGRGRRTSMMDDQSGNTTWTYDARGRVTNEAKTITGAGSFNTFYAYDAMDRVKTITYPTGEVVTQTYNNASQLSSAAGTNNYASGMTYNALGQLKQVTLGNGAVTSYAYYGDGGGAPPINSFRLWQINTNKPGTNLLNLQYAYDNVGNVRFISNTLAGENLEYEYDVLDRLINAKAPIAEAYEYNSIGNILNKAGVAYAYSDAHKHAAQRVAGSGGASKTIQIRAYSTTCYDGVGATMELWVNGGKQQTWTNVPSSWTVYSQNVILSGNDEIEVVFTNDCAGSGYDRNLIVDYIVVDGRTIQAEGSAVILDRGDPFDGQDILSGQEGVYWTGGLRFAVGPKAFAGCYDANGNMTCRLEDGAAYLQSWNAENRLSSVAIGGQTTTFIYDGDGNRVKKVDASGTTVYVGNLFEVQILAPSGAPTGLSAVVASASQINLAWADNSTNESGFRIERSPNGSSWTEIATVGANTTTYQNTGLTCGTTYYYRIQAYNGGGNSVSSNEAHATTLPCATATPTPIPTPSNQLSAPSNLSIAWSECRSELQLWWTDNSSNEDGFIIERALEGGTWFAIAGVDPNVTTVQDDIGWNMNVNYSYRVRAYNGFGSSDYSNVSNVYTSCEQADVPGIGKALLAPKYVPDLIGLVWRMLAAMQSSTAAMPRAQLATPPAGQIWKSYYFAGSQRVAMRVQGDPVAGNNGVIYFAADHLGSTSLTMDASGNSLSTMGYKPFGETRYGTSPTDRRFTGQREENGLGSLYDYGARFYSPVLGRFLSADTLMQDWRNPQAYNRYAYVFNNPLKYFDPTGHFANDEELQKYLGFKTLEDLYNYLDHFSQKFRDMLQSTAFDFGSILVAEGDFGGNYTFSCRCLLAQSGENSLLNLWDIDAQRAYDTPSVFGLLLTIDDAPNWSLFQNNKEKDIGSYAQTDSDYRKGKSFNPPILNFEWKESPDVPVDYNYVISIDYKPDTWAQVRDIGMTTAAGAGAGGGIGGALGFAFRFLDVMIASSSNRYSTGAVPVVTKYLP